MLSRIKGVRDVFAKLAIDALFVTDQNNVSYLTGFSGLSPYEREGFFLLTGRNAYLLTFPTYFGLYEKGGEGFTTRNITRAKRLSEHLSEVIEREKIKSAGFEKDNLTIAELDSLKNKLGITFVPTEGIVETGRLIKNEEEIKSITKAAAITDLAFNFIKTKIKMGVTEKELALTLEFFLKKTAGDIAFAPIVAFNANAAIPHYLPSNTCNLKPNTLILLDFGAKVAGYCADMTRVIFFGKPKSSWVKIYETVRESQKLALEKMKVSLPASVPDQIARDYIVSQGFPDYPHGLGHGVGLAIHESPRLRLDSKEILAENMVVTVEPGIYLPGEAGVRIEDLVVLKDKGIEILSKSPKLLKEPIIL